MNEGVPSFLMDWKALEAAGAPSVDLAALRGWLKPVASEGALPARVKYLIFFYILTEKGDHSAADEAMRAALDAGLTRAELLDALMGCNLSRGSFVLQHGLKWLAVAPAEAPSPPPAVERDNGTPTHAEMLAYFNDIFGELPDWLRLLAESAPSVFAAYFHLRSHTLRDGALPRRYKELMIVAVNCMQLYHFGVETHLKGAFLGGATFQEAVEALLIAVVAGGVPAWIESAPILLRLARAAGRA